MTRNGDLVSLHERRRAEVDDALDAGDIAGAVRVLAGHVGELDGTCARAAIAAESACEASEQTRTDISKIRQALEERPRRSTSDVDAQALGREVEALHAQYRGDIEAMTRSFGRLERVVGAAPNAVMGVEGSGLWKEVHRMQRLLFIGFAAATLLGKGAELLVTHLLK
jgi:hypothetical protein